MLDLEGLGNWHLRGCWGGLELELRHHRRVLVHLLGHQIDERRCLVNWRC